MGYRIAEIGANECERGVGILDNVVQQGGAKRIWISTEQIKQNLCNG